MFFDKEDEDQDFLSPGGSKLGALFGMDRAENSGGNESLTYTAPKQPKKKESTPPAKGGPSVAFAVAVHAYKYVDNKYASQGKLGAALLANHAANEYSILMYVSQQQKVTTAKITSAFKYTTQPNNYANFYDDARVSWSVLFDSEKNATDFAKHVCIAKALSTGPTPSGLVSQDLAAGEGGSLETGDSVEVRYTGWLLTNNTIGQEFDSNVNAEKLFRFKLGAGKVIKGWDTGTVGMKKGGKRFLVVPPSLAYGSQGMGSRVPANSTLLFQVEVVRVKLVGRESSPAPSSAPSEPSPAPSPAVEEVDDQEEDDHTVKGRTRSITEQITHTQDTSKAKLISRMAKMGKPMLPLSGAVAASPDSDGEPVPQSPQPMMERPDPSAAPVHRPVPQSVAQNVAQPVSQAPVYTALPPQSQSQPAFLHNLPGAQQMAVYQSPQQTFLQQQQQQQAMMQQQGLQPTMYAGGVATQPQQAVPGTSFPQYYNPGVGGGQDMMLMSETRQHNTEMRMAISKVTDKVDQVINKLDQSQTSGTSMLPNMETTVLLHNITRIVQENERLKKDVFEKSSKIEAQNEKISELLQRNQSFVEKSQVLMEQRNEGLLSSTNQNQAKLLSLEKDKVELTQQLTEATSRIGELQLEVATMKKKEFELSQTLDSSSKDTRRQTEELSALKTQHAEDESRIAELQRILREEKQARKSVENKMSHLQEEMSDLTAAKESIEKNLSERKRKAAEDRRQLEDEMEDLKANFEAEIQSLKGKLRKQKSSASAASQEQISQLEEEINRDWQVKCDKLLTQAADKHARALQTVREEKEELEAKVTTLQEKIQSLRSDSSSSEQTLSALQDQVTELSAWKDKYDKLRSNASAMKDNYEERIQELEEEQEGFKSERSELREHIQKLKTSVSQVQGAGDQSTGGKLDPQQLLAEVKKIMNTVYKEMREVFEADESYTGSEILAVILNAIKSTTLSLMKRQAETEKEDEDESEEEDDDEEEEDDDDDEEEEEEEESDKDEEDGEAKEDVVVAETSREEEKTENQGEAEKSEDVTKEVGVKDGVDEGLGETKVQDIPAETQGPEVQEDDKGPEVKQIPVAVQDTVGLEKTDDIQASDFANNQVTADSGIPASGQSKEQPLRSAGSLEDLLDTALDKGGKTDGLAVEPPPLPDEGSSEDEEEEQQEKDRTKSIFQDSGDEDDNVEDTLGISAKPQVNGEPEKKATEKQVIADEDLKPKPPPPLFGDDDDDEDLDWLS